LTLSSPFGGAFFVWEKWKPERIGMIMNKLVKYVLEILQDFEKLDKAQLAQELRELFQYINRQVFSQIPGVSAIAGLLVGSWVASTFTTSRFKGFLASWGVIKGGTRLVSTTTYSFLSISLPILAAALTAYIVQKALKTYREKQLERNLAWVAQLEKEVQAEIQEKLNILEKAREAGLVSASEYSTKKSNLYQAYSRTPAFKFQEFLIKKLTS
jgi:hypothetical protein